MKVSELLTDLQIRQRQHDEHSHPDVCRLTYPERIKHLTFHFAKYSGRLCRVNDPSDQVFHSTLVDSFVIALSTTDLLQIKLELALRHWGDLDKYQNLPELGLGLKSAQGLDRLSTNDVPDWYFRRLAVSAGVMAKACESLDHMESFDYRLALSTSVIDIARDAIIASAIINFDLASGTLERWLEIEKRRTL